VSEIWVNLGVVLLFVLVGGFFSAAELALVSVRESQVARLAENSKRGRTLAGLTKDPNRFLATVQVGVTLAGFISELPYNGLNRLRSLSQVRSSSLLK
jgi:putative hemolysin